MVLSFLVDLCLLAGAGQLAGEGTRLGRLLFASSLGAIYGGMCLVPDFRFLGNGLWRMVMLGLMGWICYGRGIPGLKGTGLFLLLSLALGCLAAAMLRMPPAVLVPAAGALWLLCVFLNPLERKGLYVPVRIRKGDTTVQLIALRDTGNTLKDPVTGEPVLVISRSAASRLTGLTDKQIRKPLETIADQPVCGLRLIPYRAVGGSGMLLALRFSDVKIGNRQRSAIVAFAPEGLENGGRFQALTGGML